MHELTPAEYEKVIDGLAAIAVSVAGMGASKREIQTAVVQQMDRFGTIRHDDASAIVAAIGRSPEPPDYDAEELEGRRAIHEMLDLPMPAEELEQTLRAREAVQEIADALAF